MSIQFSPDGRLSGYGRDDATLVVARNPFFRQPGDVNGDGCVNNQDLSTVLFAVGRTGGGLPEDINGDGIVSDRDLGIVLRNFERGC